MPTVRWATCRVNKCCTGRLLLFWKWDLPFCKSIIYKVYPPIYRVSDHSIGWFSWLIICFEVWFKWTVWSTIANLKLILLPILFNVFSNENVKIWIFSNLTTWIRNLKNVLNFLKIFLKNISKTSILCFHQAY